MKNKFTDYLFLAGFILAYIAVVLVVWDALQPQNMICNFSFGAAALSGGCVIASMVFLE